MTRNMGYALLAGFAAVVVLVSTAIFIGVGSARSGADSTSPPGGPAAPASSADWVGTWSASPAAAEPKTHRGFTDTSIRNVVHTSVGGSRARIHFSNLFGETPLTISHATVALAAAPSSPTAATGSMRSLTFDQQRSVTIPAGGKVTSDAVQLNVPAAADLLVTSYSPDESGPATYHPFARQTSYLAPGNQADSVQGQSFTQQTPYWRYVTAVDVWSSETTGAVAVLGDSLTDGITSSPGANRRMTDFLSERLRTERGAPRYSVLNAGISGNRILYDGDKYAPNNGPSAIRRMDRDALSQAGVRTVIIELGLNDLLKQPRQLNADRIVSGLENLVQQAHEAEIRVIGGTLTPIGGHRGFGQRVNDVRQEINQRIRAGGIFDSMVDFDAALRDPARPQHLRAAYDSGDGLHPNDNGYRAMAEAIDLKQLKADAPAEL